MAYSNLQKGNNDFAEMMNEFGVVTVMNATVYDIPSGFDFGSYTAEGVRNYFKNGVGAANKLAHIDTLKVANITVEGPSKTVTGGQYSNPLIKFGKSARLEMQDALGRADAVEAFGGAVRELTASQGSMMALHITEDFAPARLIIGESFFISKKTGQQVRVDIVFYQVLPDSIFNLTQDAEGDATVFDMNADLLTTEILVGHKDNKSYKHGVFYSIIGSDDAQNQYFTTSVDEESGVMTITPISTNAYRVNGKESETIDKDQAKRIVVTTYGSNSKTVYDAVVRNY